MLFRIRKDHIGGTALGNEDSKFHFVPVPFPLGTDLSEGGFMACFHPVKRFGKAWMNDDMPESRCFRIRCNAAPVLLKECTEISE